MGNGNPTEAEAQKLWVASNAGQFMTVTQPTEVVSFKKTNGVAGEVNGVKTYHMNIEITLRCKKDWNFGSLSATEPHSCKAGQNVVYIGEMTFAKTENGWQSAEN
jgi:hypothetical protein